MAKQIRQAHGSSWISSLISYEIDSQRRYVSMGNRGEAYEYVIQKGQVRKLSETEEQLAKQIRKAHGVGAIEFLTSYEINGQRRYVSMGNDGQAYEYVIENGQARKLEEPEEQLAKQMREAHGSSMVRSLTSYEIDGQRHYVSMGNRGEAYEYVIENGQARKLEGTEEQLAKQMREEHGSGSIYSLIFYEINNQRRYVSVGSLGAFAYGQDLKEAGALSAQQQAKIQELERKRDTLKQLLAAVLPNVSTYGPVYQLPPQDPYAQLAQQIRQAHGESAIYSLTSYEISIKGQEQRRYVSMGNDGKVYEYVIENGQVRKLEKTEEQLAKQIRQAHGRTWIYSLTSYEIDGQIRYVSMGQDDKAYEYVIENGQARKLKGTEEQLAKQMRQAHGKFGGIYSLTSYEVDGQKRYVSIGISGQAYEYMIENGQARQLEYTEEQLAKQMRQAHGNSWIFSLTSYAINGQSRYVSMGADGEAYEYVIENGQAMKLEGTEEQLAKQMRKAHRGGWISSLISYEINGQRRYVSMGGGEAYEYVIENGQARKLEESEEQLAMQMRQAYGSDEISSLTSYEINNQRRYVSTGSGSFAYGQDQKQDQSMKVNGPGGIDLTPANMNLQTQNNGGEIKFHLDPAQLAQLQNAPGFVPVIINIRPMTNLRMFLGLKEQENNTPLIQMNT